MDAKDAIRYLEQMANGTRIVEYRRSLSLAIAALREQEERRWIPVTERLPESGVVVLVYGKFDGVCVDYYDGYAFCYCGITHWMPLPEKPKGE